MPERILVRRGYVRQTAVPGASDTLANDHSVVIYRYRNHVRTCCTEYAAGAVIAGVLYPDVLAFIDEHAGREVDALLRPGDNDHLLGPAANTATGGEVFG